MRSSARLLLVLVALAGASPVSSAAAGYDPSTEPAVRATRGALAPGSSPGRGQTRGSAGSRSSGAAPCRGSFRSDRHRLTVTGARSRRCGGFAGADGIRARWRRPYQHRRGRTVWSAWNPPASRWLSPTTTMNPRSTVHTFLLASVVALAPTPLPAGAEEPLLVYGPGGPAPAMKEPPRRSRRRKGSGWRSPPVPPTRGSRRHAPTPTSSTAGPSTWPDLIRPGLRVVVVQGAGQTGMWEDIAGTPEGAAIFRKWGWKTP